MEANTELTKLLNDLQDTGIPQKEKLELDTLKSQLGGCGLNEYQIISIYKESKALDPSKIAPSTEESINSTFSRTNLAKQFGTNFCNLGFTKKGAISREVNPRLSPAVKDGRVLLNEDGTVDRRCSAFRRGDIALDIDGHVIASESRLVQDKELTLRTTNSSHIWSFEVADAVFKAQNLSVTFSEAEQLVRALNMNDNLQVKSRAGNMSGTVTMKDKGDLALDKEIKNAILNGVPLTEPAATRARRIMDRVTASKGIVSDAIIQAHIQTFSRITDADGRKICRSNVKVRCVKEGESRRYYGEEKIERKTSGLTNDGTPDLRTKKGQEIHYRMETGLKPNGSPDMRTRKGREIAEEQSMQLARHMHAENMRVETGLKPNGSPDMRTRKGREIVQNLTSLASIPRTPSPPIRHDNVGGDMVYYGGGMFGGGFDTPTRASQHIVHIPTSFSPASVAHSSGGTRFYKGGQFVPGGGRAPKGGGYY